MSFHAKEDCSNTPIHWAFLSLKMQACLVLTILSIRANSWRVSFSIGAYLHNYAQVDFSQYWQLYTYLFSQTGKIKLNTTDVMPSSGLLGRTLLLKSLQSLCRRGLGNKHILQDVRNWYWHATLQCQYYLDLSFFKFCLRPQEPYKSPIQGYSGNQLSPCLEPGSAYSPCWVMS